MPLPTMASNVTTEFGQLFSDTGSTKIEHMFYCRTVLVASGCLGCITLYQGSIFLVTECITVCPTPNTIFF